MTGRALLLPVQRFAGSPRQLMISPHLSVIG